MLQVNCGQFLYSPYLSLFPGLSDVLCCCQLVDLFYCNFPLNFQYIFLFFPTIAATKKILELLVQLNQGMDGLQSQMEDLVQAQAAPPPAAPVSAVTPRPTGFGLPMARIGMFLLIVAVLCVGNIDKCRCGFF